MGSFEGVSVYKYIATVRWLIRKKYLFWIMVHAQQKLGLRAASILGMEHSIVLKEGGNFEDSIFAESNEAFRVKRFRFDICFGQETLCGGGPKTQNVMHERDSVYVM